jgi:hypothetical protein
MEDPRPDLKLKTKEIKKITRKLDMKNHGHA